MHFIGTGPGRCGTMSLARILDQVEGVEAHHERYYALSRGRLDVQRMIAGFGTSTNLVGEIGATWLVFVPVLRFQWPDLKVICLHRPKDEWVESALGRFSDDRDKLAGHWDLVEQRMNRIKDPVLHSSAGALNNDEELQDVYDFLGVESARQVYPAERRYNVGHQQPTFENKADGSIKMHRACPSWDTGEHTFYRGSCKCGAWESGPPTAPVVRRSLCR